MILIWLVYIGKHKLCIWFHNKIEEKKKKHANKGLLLKHNINLIYSKGTCVDFLGVTLTFFL